MSGHHNDGRRRHESSKASLAPKLRLLVARAPNPVALVGRRSRPANPTWASRSASSPVKLIISNAFGALLEVRLVADWPPPLLALSLLSSPWCPPPSLPRPPPTRLAKTDTSLLSSSSSSPPLVTKRAATFDDTKQNYDTEISIGKPPRAAALAAVLAKVYSYSVCSAEQTHFIKR